MPIAPHRRETQAALEARLAGARGAKARARAHFDLGALHDRNSREAAAIPHYLRALRLGLGRDQKACCLAWLASSYHKTGRPRAALRHARAARRLSRSEALDKFLARLRQRIQKNPHANPHHH